jgi:hypothetical protein
VNAPHLAVLTLFGLEELVWLKELKQVRLIASSIWRRQVDQANCISEPRAQIRSGLASNHELSAAHAATPLRKTALNYRTVSGPGSPARQPRWGGGSDRMLHSTGDSLEEVMSKQDLINAVAYVCMTKANLVLD